MLEIIHQSTWSESYFTSINIMYIYNNLVLNNITSLLLRAPECAQVVSVILILAGYPWQCVYYNYIVGLCRPVAALQHAAAAALVFIQFSKEG